MVALGSEEVLITTEVVEDEEGLEGALERVNAATPPHPVRPIQTAIVASSATSLLSIEKDTHFLTTQLSLPCVEFIARRTLSAQSAAEYCPERLKRARQQSCSRPVPGNSQN